MTFDITHALRNLRPNSAWRYSNAGLDWWDESVEPPTDAEIQAEIVRLQAEYEATQYQRDRAAEYPSIEALVVALWEGVVEERMAAVTQLETLRQAVKAKYPKG